MDSPPPGSFDFDREHLQERIQAYKAEAKTLISGVMMLLLPCILVAIACVSLVLARLATPYILVVLIAPVVIGVAGLKRFIQNLEQLRKKYGLLCPSCGKSITKSGWRGVLKTGICELCGVELPKTQPAGAAKPRGEMDR